MAVQTGDIITPQRRGLRAPGIDSAWPRLNRDGHEQYALFVGNTDLQILDSPYVDCGVVIRNRYCGNLIEYSFCRVSIYRKRIYTVNFRG